MRGCKPLFALWESQVMSLEIHEADAWLSSLFQVFHRCSALLINWNLEANAWLDSLFSIFSQVLSAFNLMNQAIIQATIHLPSPAKNDDNDNPISLHIVSTVRTESYALPPAGQGYVTFN